MPSASPQWYKDAVIYQLHVRAFFDDNDDGIGDFRGLTASSTICRNWASRRFGCCRSIPRRCEDDGYDIADYYEHPSQVRHAARLSHVSPRSARPRPARHHRAGAQPHVRPASLVPARANRQAGQPLARFLRLERHARQIQGRADHLQGFRNLAIGPGIRWPRPITGTASIAISPI